MEPRLHEMLRGDPDDEVRAIIRLRDVVEPPAGSEHFDSLRDDGILLFPVGGQCLGSLVGPHEIVADSVGV